MTACRALAIIAAAGLVPASSNTSQQTRDGSAPRPGTAVISGTVVSGLAPSEPVRRATVTLTTGAIGSRRLVAVTDEEGHFTFTSLPGNRYALTASKGGYLASAYGTKRPGGSGTPIVVADGARVTGITLSVFKGSVLTGTVRDEHGRPVPDVTVSALTYAASPITGERMLLRVRDSDRLTDDRGVYRIYGLAPGDYLVAASLPGLENPRAGADIRQITDADIQRAQRSLREPAGVPSARTAQVENPPAGAIVDHAPVYHPTALSPTDAATIALGPQEERTGIDVLLRIVPTARVEGVTTGPDGNPLANVSVYLMNPAPPPTGLFSMTLRNALSDNEGRFVLPGLAPGHYMLAAEGRAISAGLSGATEIAVEGRLVTTSITLSTGVPMTGRLVFEGTLPRPADLMPLLPMLLASREGPSMFGRPRLVGTDGAFAYAITPGTYRVRGLGNRFWVAAQSPGWTLKSMILNGVDVSDIPFEIKPNDKIEGAIVTMTDKRSEISGQLRHAGGQSAPEFVLIIFSADRRHWVPLTRRTQEVRPGLDGRFVAHSLPPGDYFISAVTDLEPEQWNDPAFLAELAAQRPISISLAEGEKKVQDIVVR